MDNGSVTRNVAITIPIFGTAITIVVVLIVFWRQRVRFGASINGLYSKELFKFELSKKPSSEINRHRDEWEILKESITFEDMLGEGAFGLVKKGILKKTDGEMVEVAIKMLKRKRRFLGDSITSLLMHVHYSSCKFRRNKTTVSRNINYEISGNSSKLGIDDWLCNGKT